ncbi:MAG: hypothetical protein RI573_17230, partial [Balneolaceae bacterium]|nr:hypothetical protein [Balneolaceae bacterium]
RRPFCCIKARASGVLKANMDSGDFVVDASRVRWVIDGMDRYGYAFHEEQDMAIWDYSQDSDKWRVFKHNNFIYNRLTIDDQFQVTQVGKVGACVMKQYSADDFPYTTIDLTGAYKGQADRIHRMIAMPEKACPAGNG